MAGNTIELEFRAKMDQLRRELESIPGVNKKTANLLQKQMREAWKESAKSATISLNEIEKANKQVTAAVLRQNIEAAKKATAATTAAAAKAAAATQGTWRKATSAITGAIGQVVPGFDVLTDAADGAGTAMDGGWKAALGMGAALAGIAAAGAAIVTLAGIAKGAEDTRHEIAQLAQVTGLLPETLSAIEVAGGAELLGKMGEAAGEFQKRMSDAARGTGELLPVVERLGISVRTANGDLRSTDEVVRDFVSALQSTESATDRAAMATAAFGGAGRELMAALGSSDLEAWVGAAERFGVQVGPEAERSTAAWSVATQNLGTVVRSFVDGFISDFGSGGGLTNALNDFSRGLVATQAFVSVRFAEMISDIRDLRRTLTFSEGAKSFEALIADLGEVTSETAYAGLAAREAARDFDLLNEMRLKAASTEGSSAAGAAAGAMTVPTAARVPQVSTPNRESAPSASAEPAGDGGSIARSVAAMQELADIQISMTATVATGVDAINERYDGVLRRVFELQEATGDLELTAAAIAAIDKARATEVADWQIAENARASDKMAEDEAELAEKRQKTVNDWVSVMSSAVGDIGAIVSDIYDGQIDKARKGSAEERKLLKKQFAAQKATALAQAAINLALGISNVWATWAYMPVVAGVLTALVGGIGAAQIGLIAAKQPSFHVGGMVRAPTQPDEYGATLRGGEGVLTPAGMDAIGGERALHDLNRGRQMGGGGVAVVAIGHRVYDDLTTSRLADPQSPMAVALRNASMSPIRGRRG